MIFNKISAVLLFLSVHTSFADNSNPRDWLHVGGFASDIGAGHWTTTIGDINYKELFVINKSELPTSRRTCMNGYTKLTGSGVAIDGGGDSHMWVIGQDNFIYSGNLQGWYGAGDLSYNIPTISPTYREGADLGSNKDNDLCFVTNAPNNNIWCRPRGETGFTNIPGHLWRIDVQVGTANPIGLSMNGVPYQRTGSYQVVNGVRSHVGDWVVLDNVNKFIDISVGPDGIIWGIREDYSIWRDIGGSSPTQTSGWATKISVDNQNVPWVIGGGGRVYKYIGNLPTDGVYTTSRRYKFQKCTLGVAAACLKWEDTQYKWCVENNQHSDFFNTIGELEFWDNDRIVNEGHDDNVPCSERCEITSKQCTYDSDYSTAKLFRC